VKPTFSAAVSSLLVLAAIVCGAAVFGQPKPTAPVGCTAPEFRQFDFWVGSWLVRNAAGKEVGRSEITKVSSGCAIRESWESASGIDGMSINYFDPQNTHWHQHWVGSDGLILHLQGALRDGAMVLSSETNRIAWTHLPDGKVKQEWTTSDDAGKTWKTSFTGFYEHR
jgi:hypothetical protein